MTIGARRFTQTAATVIPGSGTISSTGTANQAAALHARRFSSIAREPSAAVAARNAHGHSVASDGMAPEEEGLSEAQKIARSDARILVTSMNSLLGKDGGGEAVGKLAKYVVSGGLLNVMDDMSSQFTVL